MEKRFIGPSIILLLLELGVNNINKRLMKGLQKMGINITLQEIKIVPKE